MAMAPTLTGTLDRLLGRSRTRLDEAAFSALYDRTYLIVFRYVYGLCGGPAQDVEDLTAETYLRAWRARESFTGDGEAAAGWLLQIARRLVIDAYRRRRARPDGDAEPPEFVAAPDAGPEEETQAREQWRALWQLLAGLSPDQREMLVLRYMLGWRVNRIARHFGLAENTVSVTIRRVLGRLRKAWVKEGCVGETTKNTRSTKGCSERPATG